MTLPGMQPMGLTHPVLLHRMGDGVLNWFQFDTGSENKENICTEHFCQKCVRQKQGVSRCSHVYNKIKGRIPELTDINEKNCVNCRLAFRCQP